MLKTMVRLLMIILCKEKSAPLCNILCLCCTEAAKKAFDAKVKENDDFVNKMKKEIDQAENRAKEKKALEKQVQSYKKTIKENEANITQLQTDLAKVSELRSKDQEAHKAELEATREAVKTAEQYCAGRFAVFSETLSGRLLSFCFL